jgi:hypothetical protein
MKRHNIDLTYTAKISHETLQERSIRLENATKGYATKKLS